MFNQNVHCKERTINRSRVSLSKESSSWKGAKEFLNRTKLLLICKGQDILLKLTLVVLTMPLYYIPQVEKNNKHIIPAIPPRTIIY
jgi:hypothetical protein